MNLKCLKLDHNGLKTFPDLSHLPKLTHLFCNYNRLSDYNDVEKIRLIPSLKELELIHNPLCRRSGYREYIVRHIPQLIYFDGIEITEEERVEEETEDFIIDPTQLQQI